MGLLSGLLSLPVASPARGLRFILEQIQDRVDAERLDDRRVEAELLDLNLRHDQGEMDEAEFTAREAELFEELNAIRARKESLAVSLAQLDEMTSGAEEGGT